jgi:hypothetical protein
MAQQDQALLDAAREEALRGMDSIASVHWAELARLESPSPCVRLLVEAVLLLAGVKDKVARTFSTARGVIGSREFVAGLDSLAHSIPKSRVAGCLKLLEAYLSKEELRPEHVEPRVLPLLLWCNSVRRLLAERHARSARVRGSFPVPTSRDGSPVRNAVDFLQREGALRRTHSKGPVATRLSGATNDVVATTDDMSSESRREGHVESQHRDPTKASDSIPDGSPVSEQSDGHERSTGAHLSAECSRFAGRISSLKAEIRELRSLVRPPKIVARVVEALNVVLGEEGRLKGGWECAKKVLLSSLCDTISNFEIYRVDVKKLKILRKFVEDEELTPATIKRVSVAATGIFEWVCAVYRFQLHIASQESASITARDCGGAGGATTEKRRSPAGRGQEKDRGSGLHSAGARQNVSAQLRRPRSAPASGKGKGDALEHRRPATSSNASFPRSKMPGANGHKAGPWASSIKMKKDRPNQRPTCPNPEGRRQSLERAEQETMSLRNLVREMIVKFAVQREEESESELAVKLHVAERHLQNALHELGEKECKLREKDMEITRLTLELEELSKQRAS